MHIQSLRLLFSHLIGTHLHICLYNMDFENHDCCGISKTVKGPVRTIGLAVAHYKCLAALAVGALEGRRPTAGRWKEAGRRRRSRRWDDGRS